MKIAIASDHAGFIVKEFIRENLKAEWVDCGPPNTNRVDYPDFATKAAELVAEKKVALAVLVCGSGIGMSIAANKIKGIRAAVVESEASARLARQHNDANVLCLGARILAPEYAKEIVQAWLEASFEGGRHADRIGKITKLEC